MMLIIYHGEPVKVNIYSGTAVCEVNTKKGPISGIYIANCILAAKHHLWFHHHLWLATFRKVENKLVSFQRAKLLVCLKLCQIFSVHKKFNLFKFWNIYLYKYFDYEDAANLKKWKYALPNDEEFKKLNIDDKSSSPFLTR